MPERMGELRGRVCVVGLGYIGLPTAALLACSGYSVHGVDIDEVTVEGINQGKIYIDEPDLDSYVRAAVSRGTLNASTTPEYADVFILCVPTPLHREFEANETPGPNLDFVLDATKSIAPFVQPGNIVILESTSPVGTTQMVAQTLAESGVEILEISIAYCPERVLPGKIMSELIQNDRIVGGINSRATDRITAFYETFIKGSVFGTDSKTAEMAKLVENSYRDVNIAFANELSMLCESEDIDVWKVIALANRHPRVQILNPGPGVGGHCIAVDPWFVVHRNPSFAQLIRTARIVNDKKYEWVVEQIQKRVRTFQTTHGRAPVIACLGLAYKPDVGDLLESPSVAIVEHLLRSGYDLRVVEPNLERHLGIPLTVLPLAICEADLIVVLVKHKQFKGLDLKSKQVLDFCGLTVRQETIH